MQSGDERFHPLEVKRPLPQESSAQGLSDDPPGNWNAAGLSSIELDKTWRQLERGATLATATTTSGARPVSTTARRGISPTGGSSRCQQLAASRGLRTEDVETIAAASEVRGATTAGATSGDETIKIARGTLADETIDDRTKTISDGARTIVGTTATTSVAGKAARAVARRARARARARGKGDRGRGRGR